LWSYLLLASLTIASLLPFSGKAFHIDDPLFVWAAQQIVQHPLDPYGFHVNWFRSSTWMWQETKNPPLASYYIAAAAQIGGWSERSLHIAFILPAIAVILGTYRLAGRFTRFPFLAALLTLVSTGFLVSSTSVMCDTMMLAFWVWAVVLWMEGFESRRILWLMVAMILVALSELTKYFGAALIPLLALYSFQLEPRWRKWAWYFLIPAAALGGFELWSKLHYGHGLVSSASTFARSFRRHEHASILAKTFEGLSFTGGCFLPALFLGPFLWSRKRTLAIVAFSFLAGVSLSRGWFSLGYGLVARECRPQWLLIGCQLAVFIAAGICVLCFAVPPRATRLAPQDWMLILWFWGTFAFAAWLNWITNARSVLPLIPAAAILLMRGVEQSSFLSSRAFRPAITACVILSVGITFWVAKADQVLADSARKTAEVIYQENSGSPMWFGGHSGFQFYMQALGAKPVDLEHPEIGPGDCVVIPENSVRLFDIRKERTASREVLTIPLPMSLTTANGGLGAGFYSDWGPLPFAFGSIPPERYFLIWLKPGGNLDGTP
jgi:4-amino-4-deoxy-L-arabinose transferase-like glycosyltransferase